MRRLIGALGSVGVLAGLVAGSAPAAAATPAAGCAWNLVKTLDFDNGDNQISGVAAVSARDVWTVDVAQGASPRQTVIQYWNGTAMSRVASPNPSISENDLDAVAAASATDIWAVGAETNGPSSDTMTQHWNGSAWSVVPSPNAGTGFDHNLLRGVTVISSNDVWAVGLAQKGKAGVNKTLTDHWNGSAWSVVPSPNVGTGINQLLGVSGRATNDVWAVGFSTNGTGPTHTLAEHWNGSAWTVVATPSPGIGASSLRGVAGAGSADIWAVGYTTTGGILRTLTEHWNGSTWSVAPSPSPGTAGSALGTGTLAANASGDVWAAGFSQPSLTTERNLSSTGMGPPGPSPRPRRCR